MTLRARANPFEIALWILGAALLVGGVAGGLWASRVMTQGYSCSGVDCSAPSDYALAQAFYMMGPPMVTAGLIAVVLSIALRAGLVGIARRTAVADTPGAGSEEPAVGTPVEQAAAPMTAASYPREAAPVRLDPVSIAPPQLRQRRRAPDHSAFQRPSAD